LKNKTEYLFLMSTKKPDSLKTLTEKIVIVISILVLCFSLFVGGQIVYLAKKNQKLQIDQAEINSIRYGLLNADEWKIYLADIISKKIEEFELTPENRQQLQEQVEALLYRLLDEVDTILKNDMGRIKRFLMNTFVDLEKLRESVPELSLALLEELEKPENKENLNEYLLQKLDTFVEETFNRDEQLRLNELLEKHGFEDKEIASARLEQKTNELANRLMINTLLLIAFLSGIFILNVFLIRKNLTSGYLIVFVVILIFLLSGISIPMINIEAKISRITFELLGENIIFESQVLFFQSKSILDVVWILISTWKFDMVIVGIMIFTFSVLFPFTKMGCSFITIQNPEKYKTVKWISFFTFKSGKWSMADVFVVALFMAFIGFNGIIKDQLSHLSRTNEYLEILTTNGTSLQPGFYLFLFFCITGLFMSDFIQRRCISTNSE